MITIIGKVIKGQQYGRTLGFPTANLDRRQFSRLKHKPKFGVWAGWAYVQAGNEYKAGIVIGPIDKTGLPKIEAHLIGLKGNLYGKKITLYLVKYLRNFKKYSTENILKAQIKKDILRTKQIL